MNCPKCNQQNPDNAPLCSSCGYVLSWEPAELTAARARLGKTLRLAVVSLVLGILSIPTWAITAIPAIVLGIVSLVKIEKSGGRLTGKGFAAIGIAIPAILCSLIGILALMARVRCAAYRLTCGTNLSGIGKAMLIYSNDYEDELPRAGGPKSKWGTTPNWQADTRSAAYGLSDNTNGQASISASLYLLVKHTENTPKSFVCMKDPKTTDFRPSEYGVRDKDLTDLWDFGPDPSKHVSYTYHIPYGPFPLTTSSDPAMAIAADRNPWLSSPGAKPRSFKAFDPNGPREAINAGNTVFHKEDGQNVLFMDGHSVFEKSSACGLNDDNIYTSWSGSDIKKGSIPTLKSQPADPNDSLLVHDPPAGDFK